uniref:Uncharacterized protein n=1 Tax=Heterorhabditis bacteriophora TaxID=37862 RepID=A0A1I7WB25_HETBA
MLIVFCLALRSYYLSRLTSVLTINAIIKLLLNFYITDPHIKVPECLAFSLDKSSKRTNCSLATLPTVSDSQFLTKYGLHKPPHMGISTEYSSHMKNFKSFKNAFLLLEGGRRSSLIKASIHCIHFNFEAYKVANKYYFKKNTDINYIKNNSNFEPLFKKTIIKARFKNLIYNANILILSSIITKHF